MTISGRARGGMATRGVLSGGFGFMALAMLASATLFAGCGEDDCTASSTCAGMGGGQSDSGTNGEGDVDPITGQPAERSFAFAPIPPQPRVMLEASLNVPIALERGAKMQEDVVVTVTGLAAGVTVEPLTIKGAETSGELLVKVAAGAKQGPFEATVEGAAGPIKASTKLPIFVRGKPATLDPTFGTDGRALSVLGGGGAPPREMLVDAADRVFVVGECGAGTCVKRLTADGAADPAYNGGAVASIALPGPRVASLDSTGRLLIGGGSSAPVVGRLLAGGQVDTAFASGEGGAGGVSGSLKPVGSQYDPATRVDAVAAGPGDTIFTLFRAGLLVVLRKLDADGKQTTFGEGGGFRSMPWGRSGDLPAGVYFGGATVTVTGSFFNAVGPPLAGPAIAQFNATSGQPDGSFGSNGSEFFIRNGVTSPIQPVAGVLLRLPSGQWLSGYREGSSKYLAMFDANGEALSSSFGTGGIAPIAVEGSIVRVARQSDGKLLVALLRENLDRILRLTPTGTPDATFGNGGVLELTPFPGSATQGVAVQSDGRILILSVDNASPSTTYVTRLWGD